MTHDEFISALMDGFLVRCESVEERFLVLKYLQDNGFRFGRCTSTYLGDNTSFDFPNPGWNKHQSEIHCWSNGALVRGETIFFEDIRCLVCHEETDISVPEVWELLE